MRITHTRFTELDYSGEGPGILHFYHNPPLSPQRYLWSVILALESFRAGFQFWFRSMMLSAWENYLSGHSPFTGPQVSQDCAFSTCQDTGHFVLLSRLYTAQTLGQETECLLRFHPVLIPPPRGKGPTVFHTNTKRCILLSYLPKGSDICNSSAQRGHFFLICTKAPLRLAGSWKWYWYLSPLPDFPATDGFFISSVPAPV